MEEFEKACRSCAYQSDELIAIQSSFDELEISENKTVADVIRECVEIKISVGDEMPQHICSTCMESLRIAFEYREKCKASEIKWREIILLEKAKRNEVIWIEPKIEEMSDDTASDIVDTYEIHSESVTAFDITTDDNYVKMEAETFDDSHQPEPNFESGSETDDETSNNQDECLDMSAYKRQKTDDNEDLIILRRARIENNRYVCEICNKSLANRSSLLEHIRIHLNIKLFACDYCDRGFPKRHKLAIHLKTHKRNELCSNKVNRLRRTALRNIPQKVEPKVTKHITDSSEKHGETSNNQAKCLDMWSYKRQNVNSDEDLKIVRRAKIENNRYICEICNKSLTKRTGLLEHIRLHLNIKLFPCDYCGRGFPKRHKLAIHLQSHKRNELGSNKVDRMPKTSSIRNNQLKEVESKMMKYITDLSDYNVKGKEKDADIVMLKRASIVNGKYVCEICNDKLASRASLLYHLRQHLGIKLHFCDYCNRGFTKKSKLLVHIKLHFADSDSNNPENVTENNKEGTSSNNDNGYDIKQEKIADQNAINQPAAIKMPDKMNNWKKCLCHICDKYFVNIYKLRAHIIWHGSSAFSFDTIDLQSKARTLLPLDANITSNEQIGLAVKHAIERNEVERLYSVVNSDGWELTLTDSESESDSEKDTGFVQMHRRMHKCGSCEQDFDRRYKLIAHMINNVNENFDNFTCEKCNGCFPNAEFLAKHKRDQCENNVKRLYCDKCGLLFKRKISLDKHKKIVHKMSIKVQELRCHSCLMDIFDEEEYKYHIENHAFYMCPFCNQRFKAIEDITNHLKCEHNVTDFDGDLFACEYCPIKFKWMNDLRKHLFEKHTKTQYKCGECDKMFPYESNLMNHFQVHGKKLTSIQLRKMCDICGKGFRNNDKLNRHKLIHMRPEEIPWQQCKYCEKKYKRKDVLHQHIRVKHQM